MNEFYKIEHIILLVGVRGKRSDPNFWGFIFGNIRTIYKGLDGWKIVQSPLFDDQECQNNEASDCQNNESITK